MELVRSENRALLANWMRATLLTGVVCVAAQMSAPLPFTPVPITLQVFGVLLAGLLLGSRWGAVAMAQYLVLGLMGAPVFALGHAGPGVLLWPSVTGGYLLSYPIAAFLIGRIAEKTVENESAQEQLRRFLTASAVGLAVIYGVGCTWLALMSRPMLSPGMALLAGAGWFLFWDALKALAAVALTLKLRRS